MQSILVQNTWPATKKANVLIIFLLILLSLSLAVSLPWLFWFNQKSGFYGLEASYSVDGKARWLDALLDEAPEHYQYVMFGFLNCTDTCPTQLATLVALQHQLQRHNVRFVYVSIDPARDTEEALSFLGKQLGPQFRLVRPQSHTQAQQATNAFRDFAAKNGSNDDVQHSGRLYLLAPNSSVRLVYSPQQSDVLRLEEDFHALTGHHSQEKNES